MPILDVKFSTPIERDSRPAIASTLIRDHRSRAPQEARAHRGGGRPDRPRSWFVGGPSLAEQHKASFFLDIRVVDGTNLKDEKADYLRQVFAAMESPSDRFIPRATSTSTTCAPKPTVTAASPRSTATSAPVT